MLYQKRYSEQYEAIMPAKVLVTGRNIETIIPTALRGLPGVSDLPPCLRLHKSDVVAKGHRASNATRRGGSQDIFKTYEFEGVGCSSISPLHGKRKSGESLRLFT